VGARGPALADDGRGRHHRIICNARVLPPIAALPESDFTAKMLLENLPSGQDIFYRVKFRDLSHPPS